MYNNFENIAPIFILCPSLVVVVNLNTLSLKNGSTLLTLLFALNFAAKLIKCQVGNNEKMAPQKLIIKSRTHLSQFGCVFFISLLRS